MSRTRVLFLGEKPLARKCLLLLAGMDTVEIIGVGARLSAHAWWGDDGIAAECARLHVPIVSRERLADLHYDLLISVLYPYILPDTVIDRARLGAFNLHEAPLPRWRGCNGCSHAILAGDREYATTLHEMTADLDAGRVVAESRFQIHQEETARELYERTSQRSLELATAWFPRLVAGDYSLKPQPDDCGCHRNTRDSLLPHKRIDPAMRLGDAHRVIRALDFVPWEPAHVETPAGAFYLWIAGSAGRDGADRLQTLTVEPDTLLAELPWSSFDRALLEGCGRLIEACRHSIYLDHYPLKGKSAIGCYV